MNHYFRWVHNRPNSLPSSDNRLGELLSDVGAYGCDAEIWY